MPEGSPDNPPNPRPGRWLLEALAAGAVVAGCAAGLAAVFGQPSANIEVTAASRFVGVAFAIMGLTWLGAVFLLGRFDWAGLFRWAGAVDGAGIAVLLAAWFGDVVGWREGLKLYAILASFATLQLALAWLVWRASRAGGAAALAAVLLAAAAMTTLVWGHLPDKLVAAGSAGDRAVMAVIRYGNPLLAANDAVNPPTRFDWTHTGWMYRRYGIIGEARLVRVPSWPVACGAYLVAAAALAGLGLLVRRRPQQANSAKERR